jgi:hypothetical protein
MDQITLIQVPCIKEKYIVKAGNWEYTIPREMLGVYLIAFDLFVVFCGLLFWVSVQRRQAEYVESFKEQ